MAQSQGQHVVATRVTTDSADDDYHGAAWTTPSPIGSDISPDADGVYPYAGFNFLIDISHMLSRMLGKQMSMTETYRVTGIKIGVKNVDDIDDNDRGIVLGGYLQWFSPTKHRIDAIQACRTIEFKSEQHQLDTDSSLFSTINRYKGFRYNWKHDDEVDHDTSATAVPGWVTNTSENNWNMRDMLRLYGLSIDPITSKYRQMFQSKTGNYSTMRWSCAFNNAMHEDPLPTVGDPLGLPFLIENPGVHDFEFQSAAGRHVDVMGGLINCNVQFSNTLPNGDASPDDYDVQVELTIEGWSSW